MAEHISTAALEIQKQLQEKMPASFQATLIFSLEGMHSQSVNEMKADLRSDPPCNSTENIAGFRTGSEGWQRRCWETCTVVKWLVFVMCPITQLFQKKIKT